MSSIDFVSFFETLHGRPPFPWQRMLAERVLASGWPDLIDLPTAHGKTACIDIAVFALAAGVESPRRIWFVVDRRIVVDEAFERSRRIADALRSAKRGVLKDVAARLLDLGAAAGTPLQVTRLRGGVPRDIAWAGNPAQPAVLTSTIDQVGSRLLFRGYGLSESAWPMHAALAGNDSLILLDEAHLARPFFQTVRGIERLRQPPWSEPRQSRPLKLIVMSATPPADDQTPLARFPNGPTERQAALDHPLLIARRAARKPTELAKAAKPKKSDVKDWTIASDDVLVHDAAARAVRFARDGRQRVAVMVNRVRTAREIHAALLALPDRDAFQIELLTGRLRPVDRDSLVERLQPLLASGSTAKLTRPILLVTTQCLEVGADFSFDALISECASLDALRQRFGRLARLGEPADAPGVILVRKDELGEKKDDPIYGPALRNTWNWLTAGGRTRIEMGIDALEPLLPEDLSPFRAPQADAPVLLPAHLDLLSQTSPCPTVEPDVALFLRGIPPKDQRPSGDVRVLWRKDLLTLPQDDAKARDREWIDIVQVLRPLTAETLSLPIHEFREAMTTASNERDDGDVPSAFEPKNDTRATPTARTPFVICRGRDVCVPSAGLRAVRPGDTIVVPASDPSFDRLLPGVASDPDVYEIAFLQARGVPRVRVRIESDEEQQDDLRTLIVETANEANEAAGFTVRDRIESYAPGRYCLTRRAPRRSVDLWSTDFDDGEDELLYADDPRHVSLEAHTADVLRDADQLLGRLSLPQDVAAAIRLAARLHDLGKADPRFQHVLHRRPWRGGTLRAKSDPPRLPPRHEQQLADAARLPDRFRHELLSLQLAERASAPSPDDLCLHLVAAHHGRCRPFAPLIHDETPPPVSVPLPRLPTPLTLAATDRLDRPPHHLQSGVTERFWSLTRRFGWWGLAYLETVLRAADQHASALSEESPS